MDPEYAAYYHLHSRLDSRLPPPLYSPGQSWQVWAPPGLSATSNQSSNQIQNGSSQNSPSQNQMEFPIQADLSGLQGSQGPPGLGNGLDFLRSADNNLTRPLSRNSQDRVRFTRLNILD
jgi:hypothetical protein